MPPHFVHRMVQYSDPARPEMMLRTFKPASHSGQLDRTAADFLESDSRMCSLPHLIDIGAALVEIVDAGLGILDRRIGIGPGETDFEFRKRHTVDDDRFEIRAPDSGVPEASSGLESHNLKAIIMHVGGFR